MDFLTAPSNFLVQWFLNFDSRDLGLRDLGVQFSCTAPRRGQYRHAAEPDLDHDADALAREFTKGGLVKGGLAIYVLKTSQIAKPPFTKPHL